MKTVVEDFLLEPANRERLSGLVGPEDENLKQIEKRLGVSISYSGAHFHLEGGSTDVRRAEHLIKELYLETAPVGRQKKAGFILPEQVHLAITEKIHVEHSDDETSSSDTGSVDTLYKKAGNFKTKRGFVKARTANQSDYIAKILSHDVTFGVGPAGTGKTYLAVAAAVDALERNEIRRIVLTRPAVEAGEKLGFLPGDLSQKVDPYLRPLYDALFEMLGFEKVEKLIERQVIEIAPLAYMRGRTLNDAFIILDEAQNTTIEQMKMFLTRIGFNSHAVITGDPSQIDLPHHIRSGLKNAIEVLKNVKAIGFTFFNSEDVVRHPVVAAIVSAYADFEASEKQTRTESSKQEQSTNES